MVSVELRKVFELVLSLFVLTQHLHNYIPYSNFSLQQSCSSLAMQVCKLAASSARQNRKFIPRLQQVNANFEVTIRQTCSELVASSSFQTSSKKESTHTNLGFEPRTTCLSNLSLYTLSQRDVYGRT
ncbi:hypothetical protein AVEN_119692-1 [Araneus ventricosus]|uniref:Uncharacterized protein n=1 Tax=Araneus ventricosus TaxID=182803 RepID=A0A4Y2J0T0_ARAVE|nr:hypothetical protein AVEN_119692-1 [Araneus ventricosus]